VGPVGPTDKENQVRCIKSTVLGILPLWNGKDPDPYQRKKQDPDPFPYQKGLDPQHWNCLSWLNLKKMAITKVALDQLERVPCVCQYPVGRGSLSCCPGQTRIFLLKEDKI
jgi:hypothetical protein